MENFLKICTFDGLLNYILENFLLICTLLISIFMMFWVITIIMDKVPILRRFCFYIIPFRYIRSLCELIFRSSLSLYDIACLARDTEDSSETIKQFYDWKHKFSSFIVKTVLAFILGNIGVLIKMLYESMHNISTKMLLQEQGQVIIAHVIIIGLMSLIASFIFNKVRKIPQEYMDSIHLYNSLRIWR